MIGFSRSFPNFGNSKRANIAKILIIVTAIAVPAGAIKIERLKGPHARGLTVQAQQTGVEVVSGEALVRFDSFVDHRSREASLAAVGARIEQEFENIGWTHVVLPEGIPVAEGLVLLTGIPGVLDVAANHAYRAVRVPNDQFFWTQSHLDKVDAPTAWDYEVGNSSRVTVAVLDTGIEGSHPDLSSKLAAGSRYCSPGANKDLGTDNPGCVANEPPTAACNHATRVAGVAAARGNNLAGVSGISWGAQLLSMKIFRDEDCDPACSSNSCGTDDTSVIQALAYLETIDNETSIGKIVANMSFGCSISLECPGCPAAVDDAITSAVGTGNIVVIAASGNDGGPVNSPAKCTNAIPVGALDSSGEAIAAFSSRGAELANNGVVAPGVSLVTTDVGGSVTGAATGTSFSAPLVSGLAALMWSADPTLTPAQIKSKLRSTAIDLGPTGNDNTYGGGSVSACAAIKDVTAGAFTCLRKSSASTSGLLAFGDPDEQIEAFPNPFRPASAGGATIRVPGSISGGSSSIKIYTMQGELVRQVPILGGRGAWDGKNDGGNMVATGVYLILVKTGAGLKRGRLAVIR